MLPSYSTEWPFVNARGSLSNEASVVESLGKTLHNLALTRGATVGSFQAMLDTTREHLDKMESLINESTIEEWQPELKQ
jgi:hypothetical protein